MHSIVPRLGELIMRAVERFYEPGNLEEMVVGSSPHA